jgi:hypothetical protein
MQRYTIVELQEGEEQFWTLYDNAENHDLRDSLRFITMQQAQDVADLKNDEPAA